MIKGDSGAPVYRNQHIVPVVDGVEAARRPLSNRINISKLHLPLPACQDPKKLASIIERAAKEAEALEGEGSVVKAIRIDTEGKGGAELIDGLKICKALDRLCLGGEYAKNPFGRRG